MVEETPLVTIGVSPHAPYTCSLETYQWCLSLGIPVGTHLAESAAENEWLEHGTGILAGIPILVPPTGKRAVASLEPVLGPDLLCAHCVDVSAEEIALLAERSVPVAHCPRSNALLGCGVAPLAAMRAAGIVVGLGTDSPASTPSFDVFEEMRAAVSAARALERRPEALLAADVAAARHARCSPRPATRRSGGYPDRREARRPDGRVARGQPLPPGRGSHGRRSSSAARRNECSRRSSTATPAIGSEEEEQQWQEVRSTASAARRRMLRSFIRSGRSAQAEAAPVAGGALLSAAPGAREVGFRAARRRLRARVRASSASARARRGSATRSRTPSTSVTSGGTSISSLQNKAAKHPNDRDRLAQPRHRLRTEAAHAGRRHRARALHRAAAQGQGALAELASQYGTLATNYSNDYPRPSSRWRNRTSPASAFGPPSSTPFGKALAELASAEEPDRGGGRNPCSHQAADRVLEATRAPSEMPRAPTSGSSSLNPNDATSQIQLGQAAQAAGTRRPRSRRSPRS